MKRLFTLAAALTAFLLICANSFAQTSVSPYKVTYSADFKIGKPAQATRILELWKDWDDNQLDRHDYFADTVSMIFSDGTVMKGKKENLEASKNTVVALLKWSLPYTHAYRLPAMIAKKRRWPYGARK